VAHNYYKELNIGKWLENYNGLIVDSNNVLTNQNIKTIKDSGASIKVIGRGDI